MQFNDSCFPHTSCRAKHRSMARRNGKESNCHNPDVNDSQKFVGEATFPRCRMAVEPKENLGAPTTSISVLPNEPIAPSANMLCAVSVKKRDPLSYQTLRQRASFQLWLTISRTSKFSVSVLRYINQALPLLRPEE